MKGVEMFGEMGSVGAGGKTVCLDVEVGCQVV